MCLIYIHLCLKPEEQQLAFWCFRRKKIHVLPLNSGSEWPFLGETQSHLKGCWPGCTESQLPMESVWALPLPCPSHALGKAWTICLPASLFFAQVKSIFIGFPQTCSPTLCRVCLELVVGGCTSFILAGRFGILTVSKCRGIRVKIKTAWERNVA